MRPLLWAVLLTLSPGAATADPGIRVPASPPGNRAVAASPDTPLALARDRYYVVQSDAPLVVLISPPGAAKVTPELGPMRVRGLFADGDGKAETRTLGGKHLYFVDAAPDYSGAAEVIALSESGVKTGADLVRRLVLIGVAPQPPPTPNPVDPPTPDTKPAALRALIVYDSKADLPAGQRAILFGVESRSYLDTVTKLGPDGKTHEWRIYPDGTDATGEASAWPQLMALPRAGLPYLVLTDADDAAQTPRFAGPLPADTEVFKALLKAKAGVK